MGWSTVVDEPSPDDLPSREIREDGSVRVDTPFAAANRVFRAFASSAMSTASTLGEIAEDVFRPGASQDPPERQSEVAEPATEERRTGRILPSLLPLKPSENRTDEGARLRQRRKSTPKVAALVAQDATKSSGEDAPPQAPPESLPTQADDHVETSERQGGRRKRIRSSDRVRAGEGWKRRRLPKACW
jgi:hypothetical protein